MPYTLSDAQFNRELENLIDKMIAKGFIKENDKEAVFQKVSESLQTAFKDKPISADLFNDPVQLKEVMLLVVTASYENKNILGFDTANLAKVFFAPELLNDPKQTLKNSFPLPVPKPGKASEDEKRLDELAEKILNHGEQKAAPNLDQQLAAYLTFSLFLEKENQLEKESQFAQAYGESGDGTPFPVYVQSSNVNGAVDQCILTVSGNAGFLNEAQDINRPDINPSVKANILTCMDELGEVTNGYENFTSSLSARPRPPGAMGK